MAEILSYFVVVKGRIGSMDEKHHLPDYDRVSIVTAMILLAYSLTAFIQLPERSLSLQLPGFFFVLNLNFFTIVSVLVALMAATGAEWIISGHPQIEKGTHWHHWLLPAFTAIVIGVPLNELPVSAPWWIVFGLGALLLVGILIAEYVSVDSEDPFFQFSSMAINVVSLGLFLILTIALRGGGFRLYVILLPIVLAAALMSARNLRLRVLDHFPMAWVGGITLIVGQVAVGLFYLPVKPIQFGMILLGLVFAMTNLAGNIEEKIEPKRIWLEPAIMFAVIFFLSLAF
jgi:hypothetical protein